MRTCCYDDEEDEWAGNAPLTKACLHNDLDAVKDYISSLPADRAFEEINREDHKIFGDTPLMVASHHSHFELMSYLLATIIYRYLVVADY